MLKPFTTLFIALLCAVSPLAAKVLVQEDFATLTSGSDSAPDMSAPASLPRWTLTDVFAAGGTAFVQAGSGLLYTPAVDLSAGGGNYMVTFRAKSTDSSGTIMVMDNCMLSNQFVSVTSEWQQYSVAMTQGGYGMNVVFSGMLGAFYIDDISVDDSGAAVPVALQCTDFSRTSFTAHWKPSAGAEGYALSVFTWHYNPETTVFTRQYLLENQAVDGTSFTVEGLNFGTPYYYYVCARRGDALTDESNTVAVLPASVSAPVAYEASDIAGDTFTASWAESDVATHYALHVVKIHTAPTDGRYDIVNTDFGYIHTEGTADAPQKELKGLLDGDWEVTMPAYAQGMIGLNNQDFSLFEAATLLSPVYDLGVGSGQVSLSFTAMARKGLTKAYAALCRYKADGTPEQLDRREFSLTEEPSHQQFDFASGTADCFIIIGSDELGIMYLHNLRLTVDMSAGARMLVPIRTYETSSTSCTASNLGIDQNDTVGYYVTALYRDNDGQFTPVESDRSNSVIVHGLSGLPTLAPYEPTTVKICGTEIIVENPSGVSVEVYSADGRCVTADRSGLTRFTIAPGKGVFIVKAGSTVVKTVL